MVVVKIDVWVRYLVVSEKIFKGNGTKPFIGQIFPSDTYLRSTIGSIISMIFYFQWSKILIGILK